MAGRSGLLEPEQGVEPSHFIILKGDGGNVFMLSIMEQPAKCPFCKPDDITVK
jgi:hypothetical protein